MAKVTKKELKYLALSQTLFPVTSLSKALDTLRFVQIDPIKAPAAAQELILRQRVKDYRLQDIERAYESLEIEEDFLYAHGYMKHDVWQLLYPHNKPRLTSIEKKVLAYVNEHGVTHPRSLEDAFGTKSARNAWGGKSRVTKLALERLHREGLVRIAKREKGIRLYEPAGATTHALTKDERVKELILTIVGVLAPVVDKTLQQSMHRIRHFLGQTRHLTEELVREERLRKVEVDGLTYYLLPEMREEFDDTKVRILTPFDPVVWDRLRFEHLWGWEYKFEAYTPPAKRVRGYYAMPLLWRDEMIGWVNAKRDSDSFALDTGFVTKRPEDKSFTRELKKESEALGTFIKVKNTFS